MKPHTQQLSAKIHPRDMEKKASLFVAIFATALRQLSKNPAAPLTSNSCLLVQTELTVGANPRVGRRDWEGWPSACCWRDLWAAKEKEKRTSVFVEKPALKNSNINFWKIWPFFLTFFFNFTLTTRSFSSSLHSKSWALMKFLWENSATLCLMSLSTAIHLFMTSKAN